MRSKTGRRVGSAYRIQNKSPTFISVQKMRVNNNGAEKISVADDKIKKEIRLF